MQWGLFCASHVYSNTCPPQRWQTRLQTLVHSVGTGTWTSRAGNHLLNWIRSSSHFDTEASLKSYSAHYPRYQIPALSRLVFLTQVISHTGVRVILCALSAHVRVQRKISIYSSVEDSPLVKLWEYKWLQGKMLIF